MDTLNKGRFTLRWTSKRAFLNCDWSKMQLLTGGICHSGWQLPRGLAPLQVWHLGAHDPFPCDAKLDTIGMFRMLLGLVEIAFGR